MSKKEETMFLKKLSVPILFWMIMCSPALSASASVKCTDGHTISASTGNSAGNCEASKNGVTCSDGNGNSGEANCDGVGQSSGSGTSSARKNAGLTSPPKSGAGSTSAGSAATAGSKGTLPTSEGTREKK
jgi:hypothetical protein